MGVPTKTHWGILLLDKIRILQGAQGATTIEPDATHPPAICQNLWGGGEVGVGGGGRVGGRVGAGVLAARRGGDPKRGRPRTTHYYHMHTSRVCVCLGHGGIEVCMR